jgi:hypothetical protein
MNEEEVEEKAAISREAWVSVDSITLPGELSVPGGAEGRRLVSETLASRAMTFRVSRMREEGGIARFCTLRALNRFTDTENLPVFLSYNNLIFDY